MPVLANHSSCMLCMLKAAAAAAAAAALPPLSMASRLPGCPDMAPAGETADGEFADVGGGEKSAPDGGT